MRLNQFATMALIISAASVAPEALASSRFSIENLSDTKVNVYIYSGGDPFCSFEEKLKSVSPSETDSFGCTGNGKNQCKIELYAKGSQICKSDRNACNNNAIKRPNKSELKITGTLATGFECELDD